MTQVLPWVKELTESVIGGSPFHIGQEVLTDRGYKVKIIDGQYWGSRGLSNFWAWRRILPNGKLSKIRCSGYGYITKTGRLITKNNSQRD